MEACVRNEACGPHKMFQMRQPRNSRWAVGLRALQHAGLRSARQEVDWEHALRAVDCCQQSTLCYIDTTRRQKCDLTTGKILCASQQQRIVCQSVHIAEQLLWNACVHSLSLV
eukprot:jgi/Ulvmu1/12695/UM094_0054.1